MTIPSVRARDSRGHSPDDNQQRVLGGQVASQALVATGRTVPPERSVHSLHSYFLRPGDPEIPIVYNVDRIRDGRSFTTRRVVAIQHGRAIFMLSASFHIPEQGPEHHAPMPDVPEPESLQSLLDRRRDATDLSPTPWLRPRAVELRYVRGPPWEAKLEPRPDDTPRRPECLVWMRAGERLPDDPLIHVCAVTYASDMTLLDAVLLRHGLAWQARVVTGASWTTRCGSTPPSVLMSGCSICSGHQRRRMPAASPWGESIGVTVGSSRQSFRRG